MHQAPAAADPLSTIQLVGLVEGIAGQPYKTDPVDQLTHALQAAAGALGRGADDELVLAAALHDIGRAVPGSRTPACRTSWPAPRSSGTGVTPGAYIRGAAGRAGR